MTADTSSQRDPDAPQRVFISYARTDEATVAGLADGLRSFGADVWMDSALVGGREWWDEILRRIGWCDVFVQAVSAAGIESEACTRERGYARALRRPMVPVVVDSVDMDLLPEDLARLQVVRYIDPKSDDAFRVARALRSCPPAPPLPDPLPAPPEVPVSYLHGLRDKVLAPSLTLDEQLVLVSRLEAALERDEESGAAMKLLERFGERDDLYEVTARRIDRLLGGEPQPPGDEDRGGTEPDRPPPGMRPAALAGYAILGAAAMGLVGGALREATRPEDGAGDGAEILALALARTATWALIVAVVSAVIARAGGGGRPIAPAMRGLLAGAVAGLAGGLVHGVLTYSADVDSGTSRLIGLALTGVITGAYLGRRLQARPAGFAGGLIGGLAAGLLVMDWPGPDAAEPLAALSWVVHAVPICAGAVGLALLRRRPARLSEPMAPVGPAVYR